jgi:hypothetical protein
MQGVLMEAEEARAVVVDNFESLQCHGGMHHNGFHALATMHTRQLLTRDHTHAMHCDARHYDQCALRCDKHSH